MQLAWGVTACGRAAGRTRLRGRMPPHNRFPAWPGSNAISQAGETGLFNTNVQFGQGNASINSTPACVTEACWQLELGEEGGTRSRA